MTLMPEILREGISLAMGSGADMASVLSPLREIIFGALIVGFLIFEPRGLVGIVRRIMGHTDAVDAGTGH